MKRFLTLTTAAALLAPAAVAQSTGPSLGEARMENGSIIVDGVTAETPGYLVVSEKVPEGAMASDPVGFAAVDAGESDEIVIEGDFTHGGRYVIMLYAETGAEDGFQWSDGVEDLPVSANGAHVTTTFDMIVEDGESDA